MDPQISKSTWTAEEESVLFEKQAEYGNRWCRLADFLPGRTDNAIKNHFYSKLRKVLRKTLKAIVKEGVVNNLDIISKSNYSADMLYNDIKDQEISFNDITKEFVVKIITNKNRRMINKQRKTIRQKQQKNVKNQNFKARKQNFLLNLKKKNFDNQNIQIKGNENQFLLINKNILPISTTDNTESAKGNTFSINDSEVQSCSSVQDEPIIINKSPSSSTFIPDIFEQASQYVGSELDRCSFYNDAFSIKDSDLVLSPAYLGYEFEPFNSRAHDSLFKKQKSFDIFDINYQLNSTCVYNNTQNDDTLFYLESNYI